LKKEQVLISIFLITILVLSSGSMVAFAKSNAHVVKPNCPPGQTPLTKGCSDDTANIQAALNACTGSGPWCTVQLVRGTYYLASQITAYGFQGSFVGAGQGQTNIVGLPDMPSPNPTYDIQCAGYDKTLPGNGCTSLYGNPAGGVPFWVGYPGMGPDGSGSPQGSETPNPWPALFTFEGGSITISGMTMTDTSPTPTNGWYLPAIDGGSFQTALVAAIVITGPGLGTSMVSAAIDHVSMVGAAGDWGGGNTGDGVYISGKTLPSTWYNVEGDPYPITGTYSITNSVFDNIETPAQANFLVNSKVVICGNTISMEIVPTIPPYEIDVFDNSNTNVLICGNRGTVSYGEAINVWQGALKSGLLPSTVTITDNNFQVNQGANGAVLLDFEPFSGAAPTLNAVVSGNVFQNSPYTPTCTPFPSCIWGYSVIVSVALKSTTVSLNNIAGGGADGIYLNGGPGTIIGNTITGAFDGVSLDVASGVHVAGNVIRNSVDNGINVTSINYAGSVPGTPSSNDFIMGNFVHNSGTYDLYWDGQGTGNVWCHNIYQTSSPSVLPSC